MALLSAMLARAPRALPLAALLVAGRGLAAQAVRASEYDVKAVFLFNFAQFVEWPAEAFPAADTPRVIGDHGDDPFGRAQDQTDCGDRRGGRGYQIWRDH